MSLKNLAAMRSELGLREQALAAATEVAGVHRDVGRARLEAFTPDLPGSLKNLASMRSELGQCEQAPTASEGRIYSAKSRNCRILT
jgi:hypothetical protein